MARIELAPQVAEDLERILDHLQRHEATQLEQRVQAIIAAIDVLGTNPLIGRPTNSHKRELVIGRGSHGYLALYRYVPGIDSVFILAVRAQCEAGFPQR